MPRYRLLSEHYINDTLLEAGVEIGDGTMFPFSGPPSHEMEGCDPESEKLALAKRTSYVDIGRQTGAIDRPAK